MLDTIIFSDQMAFVKNWYIAENIWKLLDIIEYANESSTPGLLLLVDFEKAFDNIEYSAVDKALKWFNFGPVLRKWVSILFNKFSLMTINNGYFSEEIVASKGLFQGNPIAPYLFILVIEVLATKLRSHPRVKGMKMGAEELLLALFADDLGIILEADPVVLRSTLEILDKFKAMSGLSINYDKTVIYRLGSAKNTNPHFYSVKKMIWSNEPVKVLGIIIADLEDEMLKRNFDPTIMKVVALLNIWKQRDLSLNGKILIINSLAASMFYHKFAILPSMGMSRHVQLKKLFRDFVWLGKSRISMDILEGLKMDGGCGMVDLVKKEKTFKLQWLAKIVNHALLRELAYHLLET